MVHSLEFPESKDLAIPLEIICKGKSMHINTHGHAHTHTQSKKELLKF